MKLNVFAKRDWIMRSKPWRVKYLTNLHITCGAYMFSVHELLDLNYKNISPTYTIFHHSLEELCQSLLSLWMLTINHFLSKKPKLSCFWENRALHYFLFTLISIWSFDWHNVFASDKNLWQDNLVEHLNYKVFWIAFGLSLAWFQY